MIEADNQYSQVMAVVPINPISHEVVPKWPTQSESVHYFHKFWTIDAKIDDFVSYDICQVPAKPFLTFFEKDWENMASKNFWGPRAFGENLKMFFFSIF